MQTAEWVNAGGTRVSNARMVEAAAMGARVVESEVIGLVPEAAALEVVREALLLPALPAILPGDL